MFDQPVPGLFVVRYAGPSDLHPLLQGPLMEAVRQASLRRSVAIVFVIGEAVRSVDFAVPRFWLRAVSDPAIRIGAMAMVTTSMAVEIAARGFAAASQLKRRGLQIRTFAELQAAGAWAQGLVGCEPALECSA